MLGHFADCHRIGYLSSKNHVAYNYTEECKITITITIIFILAFVVTIVIIVSSRQDYCLNSNYVIFVESSYRDSHCSCVRSCCSMNVSFRIYAIVFKTNHRKCYVPCSNGPAAAVATRTLNKNGFTDTTSFYILQQAAQNPYCV